VLFGTEGIVEVNKKKDDSYKSYKIEIESKVPPLTKEVKEKARQAEADFFEIYSRALRRPVIGDLLMKNKAKLELREYWIPSPSELDIKMEIINKDPILIGHVYDKAYLITTWNVEGEEPFEHYLKRYKI